MSENTVNQAEKVPGQLEIEHPKPGQFKHMLPTFNHNLLLGKTQAEAEAALQLLGAKYQIVSIDLHNQAVSAGRSIGRFNLWIYQGYVTKVLVEGKENAAESQYVSNISRVERRLNKDQRRKLKDRVKDIKNHRRELASQPLPAMTNIAAALMVRKED